MKCNYIKIMQEELDTYSKAFRRLAEYVLQNNEKVAFVPIQKLSELSKVSTATIHRFCIQLGYTGYSDFQNDVQETVRLSYRQEVVSVFKDTDSLLAQQINRNIQVLHEMYSADLDSAFQQAVKKIADAENVYVIGLQADFAMAFSLYYGLSEYRDNVHILTMGVGGTLERLRGITKNDVLIVIGFRIYDEFIMRLYQVFLQQQGKIIAITDHNSPFCVWADISIVPSNTTKSYGQVMSITLIWSLVYAVRKKIAASVSDE